MLSFDPTPARESRPRYDELLHRIRAEYDEMPGLCLTRAQMQRLWLLDEETCDAVLTDLLDAGHLRPTLGGYVRT